jgi:hypothetical protein
MGIFDLGRFKGIVLAIGGFLLVVSGLLAYNFFNAGQFGSDAMAIRQVSQQQGQPQLIAASAGVMAAKLANREDIGPALSELQRASRSFDETLGALATGGVVKNAEGKDVRLTLRSDAAQTVLAGAATTWAGLKTKVDPVARFSGSPYNKNDNGQLTLNPRGERLVTQ